MMMTMKLKSMLVAAMAVVALEAAALEPRIECAERGGWTIAGELAAVDEGVCEYRVKMRSAESARPPRFSVSFALPQGGAHNVWTAFMRRGGASGIRVDWEKLYDSNLAVSTPLVCAKDCADRNSLTVAAGEVLRDVSFGIRLREEGCEAKVDFEFFRVPEAPRAEYAVTLRIDRRDVFWGDAVRDAVAWMRRENALAEPSAPDAAFAPLYSTWYQFHQDVTAEKIEAEAKIAASLGMKTIIVDDGWQTDDTSRGYAYCGDWQVSKRRFPYMAAHVKRVQALGLRYMLWYSVPFVGEKSANYGWFKGKYLYYNKNARASVLDPRFPEVRDFLAGIYEKAQREWGLDGFKLDFIDSFSVRGEDPAVADGYAGRDIRTVPEAVKALLDEIVRRLKANDPDVLIEFRQNYIGPAVAQYATMLRAGDCPGDRQANRVRVADLRLTSGGAAVHGDMLEWNVATPVEEAACTVLSSMFGTVQYSMMLSDLPPDHLEMIGHWVRFAEHHRDALQRGAFRGVAPESGYPVLCGESDAERIFGVYAADHVVRVGGAGKPVWILNGSGEGSVVVEVDEDVSAQVFDTFGRSAGGSVDVAKGIRRLAVPKGGFARLARQ